MLKLDGKEHTSEIKSKKIFQTQVFKSNPNFNFSLCKNVKNFYVYFYFVFILFFYSVAIYTLVYLNLYYI